MADISSEQIKLKIYIYNNFTRTISDFCVIPVSSASCDRALSKLTYVKTKLRSTLKHDSLEDLILLCIEQSMATVQNTTILY